MCLLYQHPHNPLQKKHSNMLIPHLQEECVDPHWNREFLGQFEFSGPFGSFWEFSGPFGLIQEVLGQFDLIREFSGPFGLIHECLGWFGTICEFSGPFGSIQHHLGWIASDRDDSGTFWSMWKFSGPFVLFESIWDHSGVFRTNLFDSGWIKTKFGKLPNNSGPPG